MFSPVDPRIDCLRGDKAGEFAVKEIFFNQVIGSKPRTPRRKKQSDHFEYGLFASVSRDFLPLPPEIGCFAHRELIKL